MIKKLISVSIAVLMIMSFHVTHVPARAEAFDPTQKVLIVVEDDIYDALSTGLTQYINDLTAEGYSTIVYQFASGTAADLKNTITTYYNTNSITGALFVGDVPIVKYEMSNDFPSYSGGYGYTSFPMDLYYMDLDGSWGDSDYDSLYDSHTDGTGDRDPEIWVGRLTSSRIYNSGYDEVGLLLNYFAKNHSYRTGTLSVSHRALTFHDDDWSYWQAVSLNNVYPTVKVINDPAATNATNYKSRIRDGFEWVHVSVHSNYYGHYFYVNSVSEAVNTHDIQKIDPTCLFYNLFACSNCRYTKENYMGGRYIFTNTYGLAAVGSTKTGSMLNYSYFYNGLGASQRTNLGQAYTKWFAAMIPDGSVDWRSWFYGMTLLGDPTLSVSPPIASIDSVSATTATEGDNITFDGSGSINNGTISAYAWRSDLDGSLAATASFSTSSLSIGNHTIYFKVQDSTGRWSSEQTQAVTIEEDQQKIDVSITAPDASYKPSYNGFTFSGTADAPVGIEDVFISIYDYGRTAYTVTDATATYYSGWKTWTFDVLPEHVTAGEQVKLEVRGKNTSGTYSDWIERTVTVRSEITAPTVVISSPSPGTVSHAGFTFTGTATDASDIAEVEVIVENHPEAYPVVETTATYDSETDTWSYTVQPYNLRQGLQQRLLVRAQDTNFNQSAWEEVIVTVDNDALPPTVAITTPDAGATVSYGGFLFSGTATDPSGVEDVWASLEDLGRGSYTIDNLQVSYNGTLRVWSLQVLPTHITPGAQARLLVRARDKHGTYSDWLERTVNVDDLETTPPDLTISTPTANADVLDTGFLFSGTATDPSGIGGVYIYIQDFGADGYPYTVANKKISYDDATETWSFDVLPEHVTTGGVARLVVRAKDTLGNYCDWQQIYVNVIPEPNPAPTVTLIAPTASSTVPNSGFRFKGDATDAHGIAQVRVHVQDLGRNTYTVKNKSVYYNASTGRWRLDVISQQITPGQQVRLWVRAVDKQGKYSDWQTRVVNVQDVEHVKPTVTILSPAASATVPYTGFRFKGDATDASGIAEVRVRVEDLARNTYTIWDKRAKYNSTTDRWRIDLTAQHITPGGQARLYVRALDYKRNWSDWQSRVVNIQDVERVKPTVTIVSPVASASVPYTGFRFKGDATDASGIAEVRVRVEDLARGIYTVWNKVVFYNAKTGRWRLDVGSGKITPGAQARLWVQAKDGVGNYSDWQSIVVNVQAASPVAPSVSVIEPASNTSVSKRGFILSRVIEDPSTLDSVRIWLYDSGRKKYTVKNARAYVNKVTGEWEFKVARRNITRGKRARLWIRAKGRAGNYGKWQLHTVKVNK